ncbi:MAG: SgcJ/EcaC family oxidoreductase, partial [Acidimicrobiia bacterium]
FDGSAIETPSRITQHLAQIFADHTPARYVSKLREIRPLDAGGALLRAVVGMVPPGTDDVEPELNAVQVLVAVRTDAGFRVAHFQNTPARFDGRPDEVASLTDELHTVLRGEA